MCHCARYVAKWNATQSSGSGAVDLIHRTVECTKAELGLKLFLTLAWHSEQGIAHYVENQ
jgi:L-2,4-diaminobutyrate decarboxylase